MLGEVGQRLVYQTTTATMFEVETSGAGVCTVFHANGTWLWSYCLLGCEEYSSAMEPRLPLCSYVYHEIFKHTPGLHTLSVKVRDLHNSMCLELCALTHFRQYVLHIRTRIRKRQDEYSTDKSLVQLQEWMNSC
jgi:hypothetical protein